VVHEELVGAQAAQPAVEVDEARRVVGTYGAEAKHRSILQRDITLEIGGII
jgi:hypothetical protein